MRERDVEGTRSPAVAGRFYERGAEALREQLRGCFLHPFGPGQLPEVNLAGPGDVRALISPHAGHMFSGPAAAQGMAALAADGAPEVVVLLGPSHYASARRAALSRVRAWRTPLGAARVDQEFGARLLAATDLVEADERTHAPEHSLEVHVPFLQHTFGEHLPALVPICTRAQVFGDLEQVIAEAQALGETLAQVAGERRVVALASTDLSHQEPQEVAQRQDALVLEAMLALEGERLLRTVVAHEVTMCGPVPVAIALAFARARGARQGRQLSYYTSGDIVGEMEGVVGYASVVVTAGG